MFMNDSTENLLDNLENELTEVIELDNPAKVTTEVTQPIPLKRNLAESTAIPVPAARRSQLLDKKDKNDENEIIQLSSMSSSASESHKNVSQKTVVVASERKVKSVPIMPETFEAPTEETFFVSKHGKWAQDEKVKSDTEHSVAIAIEPEEPHTSPVVRVIQQKLEKTPKKKPSRDRSSSSSVTSETQTTFESTTDTSASSSEESAKTKKKAKKRSRNKNKKKLKKKVEDQITSTEDSIREDKTKSDLEQAIGIQIVAKYALKKYEFLSGIFLHATGTLQFDVNLKSPRVKISFYNEDSGKQIGDSKWSKSGTFNNDFQ